MKLKNHLIFNIIMILPIFLKNLLMLLKLIYNFYFIIALYYFVILNLISHQKLFEICRKIISMKILLLIYKVNQLIHLISLLLGDNLYHLKLVKLKQHDF
jgi:hypothetical protein